MVLKWLGNIPLQTIFVGASLSTSELLQNIPTLTKTKHTHFFNTFIYKLHAQNSVNNPKYPKTPSIAVMGQGRLFQLSEVNFMTTPWRINIFNPNRWRFGKWWVDDPGGVVIGKVPWNSNEILDDHQNSVLWKAHSSKSLAKSWRFFGHCKFELVENRWTSGGPWVAAFTHKEHGKNAWYWLAIRNFMLHAHDPIYRQFFFGFDGSWHPVEIHDTQLKSVYSPDSSCSQQKDQKNVALGALACL